MDIKAPLDEVDDMDIANRYGTPIRNADRAELRAFATLIRAAALEEAAKVCDEQCAQLAKDAKAAYTTDVLRYTGDEAMMCAHAIRALIPKEKP
jgi:polysaccharide pyruvyl transferase WcaK-like protein